MSNTSKNVAMVTVAIAIAALLVSSVLTMYTAEAKSKKSEVKVYVKDIKKIGENRENVYICLRDDDSNCHGQKTVDLVKLSNGGEKSRVLVATFKIKFSSNPSDEFGPGDVSACGKLEGNGFSADCAYGNLNKIKSNQYKATIDYDELLDHLFND